MSIAPHDHAARLIGHYLKHLTIASGKRWTAANDADMQTLAELLGLAEDAPTDEIPPYQAPIVSDRQTVVLERDGNDTIPDPGFQKWRGQRRWDEDDDVRRLVRR